MKSLCLRSYVHFVTSHRITSVYYIRTSCRSTFGSRRPGYRFCWERCCNNCQTHKQKTHTHISHEMAVGVWCVLFGTKKPSTTLILQTNIGLTYENHLNKAYRLAVVYGLNPWFNRFNRLNIFFRFFFKKAWFFATLSLTQGHTLFWQIIQFVLIVYINNRVRQTIPNIN